MRNRLFSCHRACLAMVLLFPFSGASALDLHAAVEQALQRDEGLKALLRRFDATEDRAIADSALPDPEILLGAQGLPVDNPFGSDMMTMYRLGVRQRFPAGQSRQLAGERSRSDGAVLTREYQARRLEIIREVRLAWLDWAAATLVLRVADDGLEAFNQLLQLTETRYRSGSGRQRDVDQARLERSLIARRIIDTQTRIDEASSNLARWTGNLPSESGPSSLPDWPSRPDLVDIRQDLADHPMIEADAQRVESGQINTELARQAYRPSWMIEAGYAHQPGTGPMGRRVSDKFFGMVSFSVPLFTANRQDRRVAAAAAEVDALEHQRQLRLQEWEGRARNQIANMNSQQRRLELLDEIILPEARRTLESTFQAYRTDRASFDELVRARLSELDQQIETLQTRRALLKARAELAYLTGEELP